ncbi:hypothetical protein ACOSQ4_027606 [Xanthoceras sorbifolium]
MKSLHISVKFLGTRVEFDVDHPFTYTLVTFGPIEYIVIAFDKDLQQVFAMFKSKNIDTIILDVDLLPPWSFPMIMLESGRGTNNISTSSEEDSEFLPLSESERLPSDANDGGDEGHTSKDDKQADAHTTNGNYDDQQAERRTTDGGSDDQQVERHIQVMVMMINSK